MKISVIIPVYRAETYVERAVLSCIKQQEVTEVILIEDNSPDRSLAICKTLSKELKKVKLFQHPDKKNHGASSSRNLGILMAKNVYIAFLDADDYYLKDRFKTTRSVFDKYPTALGVYEATGVELAPESSIKEITNRRDNQKLITFSKNISKDQLFELFLTSSDTHGWWHLNSFTIKKELIVKIGLFDKKLHQAQDTDFILRACLTKRLFEGSLSQPVAMRCFHTHNRVYNLLEANHYKFMMYEKWLQYLLKNDWSKNVNWFIFRCLISYYKADQPKQYPTFIRYFIKTTFAINLFFKNPMLLLKIL